MRDVGRYTMSIALPEAMREHVDARAGDVGYVTKSEYIRGLIRRDQCEQAVLRLRNRIADGLASGSGREVTDDVIAKLRLRALGAW